MFVRETLKFQNCRDFYKLSVIKNSFLERNTSQNESARERVKCLRGFFTSRIRPSFGLFVIRAKVNLTTFSIQEWHVKRKTLARSRMETRDALVGKINFSQQIHCFSRTFGTSSFLVSYISDTHTNEKCVEIVLEFAILFLIPCSLYAELEV